MTEEDKISALKNLIQNVRNGDVNISSRYMAQFLNVRHDNLLRDIKDEIERWKDHPEFDNAFIQSTYADKQNQQRLCYYMNKLGLKLLIFRKQARFSSKISKELFEALFL